ncbi:MAG TPA: 4a-hydroxytetrahydrobiopterin dehydratase [Tepidisphaeraceae bacterium]|jgi:4a-hydroxytetrahydrobiopterin dehydratase|nr:4a-hydroxytetrahydrobiopterin dehydratase [Tepidisphaeraceae bacterium]
MAKQQIAAATELQIKSALKSLPGWSRVGPAIQKTYSFKNYYETIAFVNATAWISHAANHHPDLTVGYNRCTVLYSTHDIQGLSKQDLSCAQKVEALILP